MSTKHKTLIIWLFAVLVFITRMARESSELNLATFAYYVPFGVVLAMLAAMATIGVWLWERRSKPGS